MNNDQFKAKFRAAMRRVMGPHSVSDDVLISLIRGFVAGAALRMEDIETRFSYTISCHFIPGTKWMWWE